MYFTTGKQRKIREPDVLTVQRQPHKLSQQDPQHRQEGVQSPLLDAEPPVAFNCAKAASSSPSSSQGHIISRIFTRNTLVPTVPWQLPADAPAVPETEDIFNIS